MRLLVVVPAFLPARDYGGPVQVAETLLPEVKRLGSLSITVVAPNLAAYGVKNTLPPREELLGLKVIRLPVIWLKGFRSLTLWDPDPLEEGYDLAHIKGAWTGIVYQAILTVIRRKIPWIWSPHGMFSVPRDHPLPKKWLGSLHAPLARQARFLLGTSPEEKSEAPRALRELPWRFLPNPVWLPPLPSKTRAECQERFSLPQGKAIFGYLGRIHPRKGIPLLLSLWRRHNPEGMLVFAGFPEDRALIREIEHTPKTRFLGPLPREETPLFLRALSALLLLPSYGENFGNVVLEALSVGTPALVTQAVGAAAWLKGHRGLVVLTDPEKELPPYFRNPVFPEPAPLPELFSPQRVARDYLTLLHEALSPS